MTTGRSHLPLILPKPSATNEGIAIGVLALGLLDEVWGLRQRRTQSNEGSDHVHRSSVVMFVRQWLGVLAVIGLSAFAAQAQNEEPIFNINESILDPAPVAVTDFIAADENSASMGMDIAAVITNNLERSALFRPIDKNAFVDSVSAFDQAPRFEDWRLIGAEALITGQVEINAQGDLVVSFRLWDTFRQRQMAGQVFNTTTDNWRRVAHKISDLVYERYTGEAGYFDTRIVYIEESGQKTDPRTRLTIMDQDGANRRFLTDGSYWVFLPTFSPTQQEIVYVSYRDGTPKTFLFNLETGREEALFEITQDAESYSARFTPDGTRVVTTVSVRGNSDIHMYDLRTQRLNRLTREPSIEVEPSMDPTGQRIVFTSDRSGGGNRQLYVMNADGSNPQRISRGDGRYGTPVWSPRGDLIAFTKQARGLFSLGVMRTDGSGERILVETFKIDRPTWSPNGRVLLYTTEGSGTDLNKEIRSIDLTGFNDRSISTVGVASDPAWSPLLD